MSDYLQEAKGEEQDHSDFSLHTRVEIPGDFDRDQQEKYVGQSIERPARIQQVGDVDTRPRLCLVPYLCPWCTLEDLGKGDCDVEEEQNHDEEPDGAIKVILSLG